MSQHVIGYIMSIYHPLEILPIDFVSKRAWVEFFREHKREFYPLVLHLYDPDYDDSPIDFDYTYIGQRMVVLERMVSIQPHDVTPPTLEVLKRAYACLKTCPVYYAYRCLDVQAKIILERLGFITIRDNKYEGVTYVIDKDRI